MIFLSGRIQYEMDTVGYTILSRNVYDMVGLEFLKWVFCPRCWTNGAGCVMIWFGFVHYDSQNRHLEIR